jgi:uncharacterized protein HemY
MDYFNLGSVCLKKGDWKAAVGFFESSLKEDPSFADGHMGLGTALIELGEYESAAAEFQILGYKVTPDDLKQKYSAKP